jgi:hypothetical protein
VRLDYGGKRGRWNTRVKQEKLKEAQEVEDVRNIMGK